MCHPRSQNDRKREGRHWRNKNFSDFRSASGYRLLEGRRGLREEKLQGSLEVEAEGPLYRASHVLEDWVLLTWIWNVPPPWGTPQI